MTEAALVLVGAPGSGKSTVGPLLATALGRPFVDVDHEIELEEPIRRIIETGDEAAFRLRESKHAVDALRAGTPSVIALGGGAIATDQIRKALRERAFTLLVEIDAEEAWRGVSSETGGALSFEPHFDRAVERALALSGYRLVRS